MTIQDDIGKRCLVERLEDDMATARLRREHVKGSGLADGMHVEALPTVYRGTAFRSALEASWAATLDSLSIVWEYEPETITLPSGARYLPDFRLPEIGTWLEVKGPGVPRVEKAIEFGQMLACGCPPLGCTCRWPGGELVIIGRTPRPFDPYAGGEYDHRPDWAKVAAARNHGGFLRWTSTRGINSHLAQCPDCRCFAWFHESRCRACRGPLIGARGFRSGSDEFTFVRITGPAVPDETDGDAA